MPKALGYYIQGHPVLFQSYLVRQLASLYFRIRNPEFKNLYSPTRELLTAVRDYSNQRGAKFALGLTATSKESIELQSFLAKEGISCVDVTADLCYRRLGWHWTPAGNDYVANRVFEFLKEESGLLERSK